jgi:hypothetical protein
MLGGWAGRLNSRHILRVAHEFEVQHAQDALAPLPLADR